MTLHVPTNWREVFELFGNPNDYRLADGTISPAYEREHITRVSLPSPMKYVANGILVTRVAVNKAIAKIVADTLAEVHDNPEWWLELQPYAGGFEPRLQRGSSKMSLHTLGAALDFNPIKYPFRSTARMPQGLIDVFTKHGFLNGADFHDKERLDPQHVQWARNV